MLEGLFIESCSPVFPQKKQREQPQTSASRGLFPPVPSVPSKIINTQRENIKTLNSYLSHIGETDKATIDEYLNECISNPAIMAVELARIAKQYGIE